MSSAIDGFFMSIISALGPESKSFEVRIKLEKKKSLWTSHQL
jgi:hypothetical protein